MTESSAAPKRRQVGEFAKKVGKTVRAMHLYEELGLLMPVGRSKGGFRLYDQTSIERARWIVQLQGVGFSLAQIQTFVADLERAATGPGAASHARATFNKKLSEIQSQLATLRRSEADLVEALDYLDGKHGYKSEGTPANSEQQLHEHQEALLNFSARGDHADQRDSSTTDSLAQRSFVPTDERATAAH